MRYAVCGRLGRTCAHVLYGGLRSIVLAVACAAGIAASTSGQSLPKSILELQQNLDAYIPGYLSSRNIPGFQISISVGDSVVYSRGFGNATLPSTRMTDTTVMPYGSNSKRVTAAMLLQSFLNRGISLDRTAESFLDSAWWENPYGRQSTVDQILSHQGGFGTETEVLPYDSSSSVPLQTWLRGHLWLQQEPGTEYYYSNNGYGLLGAIVERVEQQEFNAAFHSLIAEPLGLHGSTFDRTEIADGRLASNYQYDTLLTANRIRPVPSSGLYSNSLDMVKFNMALRDSGRVGSNQLFDPRITSLMEEPRSLTVPELDYWYGRGTELHYENSASGLRLYEHQGWAPNFYSRTGYIRYPKVAYAWAMNTFYEQTIDTYIFEQIASVVKNLFDERPQFVSVLPGRIPGGAVSAGKIAAQDGDISRWWDWNRYHLVDPPPWLFLDSLSGAYWAGPALQDTGGYDVRLRAVDSFGGITDTIVRMNVYPPNRAPAFEAQNRAEVVEDSLFARHIAVVDPDSSYGDTLSVRILSGPSWLTYAPGTQTLHGIAAYGPVNDTLVTLEVTDALGETDQIQFVIHVSHVNHPPTFAGPAVLEAYEDSLAALTFIVSDPDEALFNDHPALSVSVLPSWLVFDSSTVTIRGVPSGWDVGDTVFVVQARDDSGSVAQHRVDIVVRHTNHQPRVVGETQFQAYEDSSFTRQLSASDPDSALFGDVLRYRKVSGGGWLAVDSLTGELSGTPRLTDLPDTTVVIEVRDNAGAAFVQAVTFRITHTNHPPVITPFAAVSVFEDSLFVHSLRTEDPDTLVGDTIAYRLINAPTWLTLDEAGTVRGTPEGKDVAVTTAAIVATDTEGAADTALIPITVLHTNHPPRFRSEPPALAQEDEEFHYQPWASDSDSSLFGDIVAYRLISAPDWLFIDPGTHAVHGVPDARNVGQTSFVLEAADASGARALQEIRIEVRHTNHPPIFHTRAGLIAREDETYAYQPWASDADSALFGDRVSYRLVSAPAWMKWDSVANILAGTPAAADVGSVRALVVASDTTGALAEQEIAIEVLHTNHAPQFQTPREVTAWEGETFRHLLWASDADSALFQDSVTYRIVNGPQWLGYDSLTQTVHGSPKAGDVGTAAVLVEARDQADACALQELLVRVVHVNHSPAIQSQPVLAAREDSLYVYRPEGSDVDIPQFDDHLHYAIVTRAAWLRQDPVTGTISGIPGVADVGTTVVTLQVSDGKGGMAEQEFSIVVIHTNHAPKISGLSDSLAYEDSTYSASILASDADSISASDRLTYAVDGAPAWLKLDAANGTLSGTPDGTDVGTTSLLIRARDRSGMETTQKAAVTVLHRNHPPMMDVTAGAIAKEDSLYSIAMRVTDEDSRLFGDRLSVHWRVLPSWIILQSDTTASGIPGPSNVGDTVVIASVDDGAGGRISRELRITVRHTNHLPSITSTPVIVAREDSAYTYAIQADDPDIASAGDSLAYSIDVMPEWMRIDDGGRTLRGIPGAADVGVHTLRVRVSDAAGGSVLQEFTIDAQHTNHQPVFTLPQSFIAFEDSAFQKVIHAEDRDADEYKDRLTYRLLRKPSWLTIDERSGVIAGLPGGANVGKDTLIVRVEDNHGGASQHAGVIEVRHSNHEPVVSVLRDTVAYEDSVYTMHVRWADQDAEHYGDQVIVCWNALPSWLHSSGDTLLTGIPRWEDVGDTVIAIAVTDGAGGRWEQLWPMSVLHVNHAPSIVRGIGPADADTVTLLRIGEPIEFAWNAANDRDPLDTLRYLIHVRGEGLDTAFAVESDTIFAADIMTHLQPETSYRWWVNVSDGIVERRDADTLIFRTSVFVGRVEGEAQLLPTTLTVRQNYPNPFNPSTVVRFGLPAESIVRADVYNLLGQHVERMLDQRMDAGFHECIWQPRGLPTGVYFLRMESAPIHPQGAPESVVVRMVYMR